MLPTSVRVVIADNDRESAARLAEQLRAAGHHVHTAHDDTRVMTLAELLRPDVVLLDLGLQSLGGEEIARQMRNAHWGAAIQLVAICEPGTDHQARSRRETFDEYLDRPVEIDVLLKVIAPHRMPDPAGP